MQFTFTHLTGSRAGTTQQLAGTVITVGRDPSNRLAFDPAIDDKVSSFHANLTVQGAQVLLTDLGSSNGTYFNGLKMSQPMPIISGANLQFGEGGPIVSVSFAAAGAAGAPVAAGAAPGAPAPGGAAPAAAAAGAVGAPAAAAAAAPGPAAAAPAAAAPPAAPAPGAPTPAAPGAAPGTDPAADQEAAVAAEVAAAQAKGQAEADAAVAAAQKDSKPSKLKTCVIPAGILVVVLAGCAAVGIYMFRDKIPSGAQRIIRRIPGGSKLLNPKIPGKALLNQGRSKVNRGKSAVNKGKRLTGNDSSTPAETGDDESPAEADDAEKADGDGE